VRGTSVRGRRSNARLLGVGVFVISLMVTLVARLFTVQVIGADGYRAAAATNREREIVTPAVRGLVLDDRGRPLIANRSALVVSINRTVLIDSKDGGRALVARLAKALGLPFKTVWGRTQLCGTKGAPKAPICYNGAPYQPVPVAQDVSPRAALQIMERSEDFPGVSAELQAVRTIPRPLGVQAAHVLGYLGPVTDAELKASSQAARDGRAELQRTDRVGRAGLEKQYDDALRGSPGVTRVGVDIRGRVTGELSSTEPAPGSYLVTSIDAKVQTAAEKALAKGIAAARTRPDPDGNGRLRADSGAAVVMDVRTGQVVAMASWPSYDPRVWLGGITDDELARLTDEKAGTPLVSRVTQGVFPPASTFKVISLPAAVQSGYDIDGRYECASSYNVGERAFKNYESQAYGVIDLNKAIVISCDTIFYKFAYETWLRLGGSDTRSDRDDPFVRMAKDFGLGKPTGIDLPDDADGRIPGREWKRAYWQETKDYYCAKARTGFPEVAGSDPSRAAFLKQLAKENCADGYVFRGGDAANFAIGQGDVTASPLQMVRAYAAIANGGTLWTPQVAKAVISPSGEVVEQIAPKRAGTVPLRPDVLALLRDSLRGVVTSGTARGAFAGFPVPVAGKTGTGEVYGKQTTSWFSSFAPADKPRFAISVVVSQGGTGGSTAAPIVRDIYSAIYGVRGSAVSPAAAALPGGRPPSGVPTIRPDGTIVTPEGPVAATQGLPDQRRPR
jgi:penicillin-binding protein 2